MKCKRSIVLFLYVVVVLLTLTAKAGKNQCERKYQLFKTSGVKIADEKEEVGELNSKIRYKKIVELNDGRKIIVKSILNSKTLLVDKHTVSIISGRTLSRIVLENIRGKLCCNRLGKTLKVGEKVVPLSILPFWLHRKIALNPNVYSFDAQVIDEFYLKVLSCDIKVIKQNRHLYKNLYKLGNMTFVETWDKEREVSELKQGDSILISEELQSGSYMTHINNIAKRIPIENLASKPINIYFGARTLEVWLPVGIQIPGEDYQCIKKLSNHHSNFKYSVRIDYQEKKDVFNCFLRKEKPKSIIGSEFTTIFSLRESLFKDVNSDVEKVCILFDWIKKNIKLVEGASPEPEVVFSKREGDCEGISNLLIAILHYENINAKPVWGILIEEEKGKLYGFAHQWVRIYIDNEWQSIDPTFGLSKLTNNYFELKVIENSEDYFDIQNILNSIIIKVWR